MLDKISKYALELILLLSILVGFGISLATLYGMFVFFAWIFSVSIWWIVLAFLIINILAILFMKGSKELEEPLDIDFTDEDIL
jgi:hypothetical protein